MANRYFGPEFIPIQAVRQILPVGTNVGQFLEHPNPKNCEGCNLAKADLSDINMEGAFLFDVNLYGANLSGADISFSNLRYANLSGANLAGAGISAKLRGSDLNGANASGTSFDASTGPDFTGVLNLLVRYHE